MITIFTVIAEIGFRPAIGSNTRGKIYTKGLHFLNWLNKYSLFLNCTNISHISSTHFLLGEILIGLVKVVCFL